MVSLGIYPTPALPIWGGRNIFRKKSKKAQVPGTPISNVQAVL